MYSEKDFDIDYKKERTKFFKKHFWGKNLNVAFYNIFQDSFLNLIGVYARFLILQDCMNIIFDNNLVKKMSSERKEFWQKNLIGIEVISKELENIIKPICEGMNVKIDK